MKITTMLPFLDDSDLDELVNCLIEGSVDVPIKIVLPFLNDTQCEKLYKAISDNPQNYNVKLEDFFPFVSDVVMDNSFMQKISKGDLDTSLLPFVSEECLDKLVDDYCNGTLSVELNTTALYPFLSDKAISRLFKTYLQNAKKQKS